MNSLMRRGAKLQTWRRYFLKNCSTAAVPAKEKGAYEDVMRERQAQAMRSIVVQVSSEKSFGELYNYCNSYGNIVGAHHYRIQYDDERHYILLEFSNREEAAAAIDSSGYHDELHTGVPVHSPFLWFKAAGKRQLMPAEQAAAHPPLDVVRGTDALDNATLNDLLRTAPHIEAQIRLLHEHTQLNDLGVRLRFLSALQLQQAVSGMFPAANAQPFGSSVNGFGKMGCDLDLILRFDREVVNGGDTDVQRRRRNESRLVFHTKENLSNGRSQTQRQMESIGDMLHLFLPGVCHVRRILQARVPIIKFHHEHLNLEVDLSMSNLTGFYMSELLYMFGECDERVRPLTFCVRRWALACGLTNPSPGRWLSNFSLTCLVIYFLQQLKQPLLPTINALMKAASAADMRVTEDGINCTFARNMERLGGATAATAASAARPRNAVRVDELLLQFFEFYSQFDFHNRAISLNEGRAIAKPDHSALYIVNPLEQVLNVSKNVSFEECERLRIEVRNAAWLLESEVESSALNDGEREEAPWGLLNLFRTADKTVIRPNMFFKPRMVDVSDLFERNGAATNVPAGDSTAPDMVQAMPPKATPPLVYKNDAVKQQVQNIKAQARTDLKQMRMQAAGATAAATTATADSAPPKGRSKRSR